MKDYKSKKIVLYSLINGVGSTTIAYQLARLLRLPLYQERKNDLVHYLKTILDPDRYTVKQLSELKKENYKNGAIYDLDTVNERIFNSATDIIVLTNNSFIDVLKTIATLQQIKETVDYKEKKIHVVFNRLQNGHVDREKKYTQDSIDLIKRHIDLNITYSYIRTNLIYYTHISDGKFFMDYFFRTKGSLLIDYPYLREVEHTQHLKILFNKQYRDIEYSFMELEEYEDTIYDVINELDEIEIGDKRNKPIEQDKRQIEKNIEKLEKITEQKLRDKFIEKNNVDIKKLKPMQTIEKIIHDEFIHNVYHKENIKNAKVVFRDMFTLLYNLEVYEKDEVNLDDEVDEEIFKDENNG